MVFLLVLVEFKPVLFTNYMAINDNSIEWTVDELYFGQMNFETWRHNGKQVQILDSMSLPLKATERNGQLSSGVLDTMAKFLATHVDCEFVVADSYPLQDSGSRQPPQLWLQGWIDGTWEAFNSGKEHSM